MTGFRNVLARAYENLDYGIVFEALHSGKDDIADFLNTVEQTVEQA